MSPSAQETVTSPPAAVYWITPHGIKKETKLMSMSVRAFTVAAPPSSNAEVTMMSVMRQKWMMVTCAALPQRASTISQQVCAHRALRFTSMARMPKSSTWIAAPLVY